VIRRYYLVGTDTSAGKTTVACALLRSAALSNVAAIPFKPVTSGPRGPASDPSRLLRNSTLLGKDDRPDLAPIRYELPVAPGVADDPDPFLGFAPPSTDADALIAKARWSLARLESRHNPRVTIIEGAGGLLVPMPGGSWQDQWITALQARPIVVTRAGLGSINHTLLTIEALRARGLEPIGFFTAQLRDFDDTSRDLNGPIIEHRSAVPLLGALPHLGPTPRPPDNTDWHRADLWARLLAG
jgi:dethiobiotin synthetase